MAADRIDARPASGMRGGGRRCAGGGGGGI